MTSESQLQTSLPRSRAEELALSIQENIRQRQLVPGDMVSTLQELRAQTGLARSTVSEAVRLLRERGLLEIRPGRGGGLFLAQVTPVVKLRHTLLNVDNGAAATRDAIELRETTNWALHSNIAAICPNEMARAVYLSTLGYLQQSTAPALDESSPGMSAAYWRQRVEIHEKLVEAIILGREADLAGIVLEHNSPA